MYMNQVVGHKIGNALKNSWNLLGISDIGA